MYLVSLIQRYDLTCYINDHFFMMRELRSACIASIVGCLLCNIQPRDIFASINNFFYRVELQGQEITKLPIKGCVVERTLELLDQDQRKIECLQFGATYYGTDRTEWAYVLSYIDSIFL